MSVTMSKDFKMCIFFISEAGHVFRRNMPSIRHICQQDTWYNRSIRPKALRCTPSPRYALTIFWIEHASMFYHAFSRYYLFSKSSLDIFLVDRTWQCAPGIGGIRGNPGPGVEGVFRLTFEQCKARFSGSGHNFVYHQRSLHCQKMNHYIPGITDGNTDWRSCTQDQSQSTYASSNIVV